MIDELGLRKQCIFHVSDEPNVGQIRTYKKAARIVHENFGDFKIIDALSQETKVRGLFRVKAPYYLVFFSEPGEEAEKNAGYLMEQLVLYLTEKGRRSFLANTWILFW